MMEAKVDLRDYMRQRSRLFRPEIGERYFALLLHYATGVGDVERSTLLSILLPLGWTEKTLDYHARLVRDCDDKVYGREQRSWERLAMLASAFSLHNWFGGKFPVPRPSERGESKMIRTTLSERPRF